MRIAKIGLWAGSLSIRLTEELKRIGMKEKDDATITIENDKIIIEKLYGVWYVGESIMTISKVDLDILEGGNYKSIIKKILKKTNAAWN